MTKLLMYSLPGNEAAPAPSKRLRQIPAEQTAQPEQPLDAEDTGMHDTAPPPLPVKKGSRKQPRAEPQDHEPAPPAKKPRVVQSADPGCLITLEPLIMEQMTLQVGGCGSALALTHFPQSE